MKVLLTGGAGFIGRASWRRLAESGQSLVVFDRARRPPR